MQLHAIARAGQVRRLEAPVGVRADGSGRRQRGRRGYAHLDACVRERPLVARVHDATDQHARRIEDDLLLAFLAGHDADHRVGMHPVARMCHAELADAGGKSGKEREARGVARGVVAALGCGVHGARLGHGLVGTADDVQA